MEIFGDGHGPFGTSEQLRKAVDNVVLQVTPENVLQVRAALLSASDRMRKISRRNWFGEVGNCGGDPLSPGKHSRGEVDLRCVGA